MSGGAGFLPSTVLTLIFEITPSLKLTVFDPEFKTMFEECFVGKMPAIASKLMFFGELAPSDFGYTKTAHFKFEHPRLLKRAVCQKTTTN